MACVTSCLSIENLDLLSRLLRTYSDKLQADIRLDTHIALFYFICGLHPRLVPGNPIYRSFQLVTSFSIDASEIIMEHRLTSSHLSDSPAVSPPDLTVCIVNWNSYDLLSKCLDSIFSTPCQSTLEIIVVDNNSNDGSAEKVEISYPQIQLIRNMDNRGFGRANNQAIPAGFGRYYLF